MNEGSETIVNNDVPSGRSSKSKTCCVCTLDSVGARSFMKIYCPCGRIVGLDKSEMQLKKKLGKDLECVSCRNLRISAEIDEMNSHFDGTSEENEAWSHLMP
ncbi:MAG: hypothetical protein KRP56_05775 [Candidatus Methanogranum gryphiswaldense]|nr:MAG: hypothetical protein KRP56_05775 [Candidatus Methanogranum sp. U3.2.1]